jgi:hypothetical protein
MVWFWHKYDLRLAPTNVRSWESNGLNADVAFGPFMTHCCRRRSSLLAFAVFLFDQLVRAQQDRCRHIEAKRLGGRHIEHGLVISPTIAQADWPASRS